MLYVIPAALEGQHARSRALNALLTPRQVAVFAGHPVAVPKRIGVRRRVGRHPAGCVADHCLDQIDAVQIIIWRAQIGARRGNRVTRFDHACFSQYVGYAAGDHTQAVPSGAMQM